MAKTNSLFGSKIGADENIVVIGLPFGHGSSQVTSCQNAPSILRALTSSLNLGQGFLWDQKERKKVMENVSISDMGDLNFSAQEGVEKYLERTEEVYNKLFSHQKKVITLGGDHLVTLPILKGFSRNSSAFQIIQIDAHADFQEVKEGDHPTHANFMNFACQLPGLKKVIQIGLRSLSNKEIIFDDKIVTSEISNLKDHLLPDIPIYITIDTDGLDPLLAPAVNHPVWNGLTWKEIDHFISFLKSQSNSIIGLDWVEYCPHLDTQNKLTALGIVNCLFKFIELLNESEANQ